MRKSLVPEQVEDYIGDALVRETEIERRLREETMTLERAGMCSSAEVGGTLYFLVKLVGARRALEVGTFTGYTALKIASALPDDGQLVCCDISEEWTSIGRPYWLESGLDQQIDLRIAPAIETLSEFGTDSFDFAFIDADKPGYPEYYERCLSLVRPGGLIVLDNMLWDGRVADLSDRDPDTLTLRELGQKIARDNRVDATMLTVGDGLILARVS